MVAPLFGLVVALLLQIGGARAADDSESECRSATSLIQHKHQRGRQLLPTVEIAGVSSKHLPGLIQALPGETAQRDDLLPVESLLADPSDIPMDTKAPTWDAIPEKLMQVMILPDPYACEFTFKPMDLRFNYCGSPAGCVSLCGREKSNKAGLLTEFNGLHPANISETVPWVGSLRMLGTVGSLPCCPTPPHCTAPSCKSTASSSTNLVSTTGAALTCTKYPALTNYFYMVQPNVWRAYRGAGGSFDLDVHKHWDVLGHLLTCHDNSTGHCHNREPFDFSIDLGSDHGSVTEKLTVRKFARDYVLVDAWPANKQSFSLRLGDKTFLSSWYQKQVPNWPSGEDLPQFEMFSNAMSDKSGGTFDMCDGNGEWKAKLVTAPCPVDILAVDSILPGKLSPALQSRFSQAQSAYIKIDLDGMDQLVIDGMRGLLSELRGTHEDGSPRYLVNFMMLEYCPNCMIETKKNKGFDKYNLGTQVQLLEDLGFEVFIIGPRYLPLSHGSWTEHYNVLSTMAPNWGASDLFAMRASHPRATEIKLALGACEESQEFDVQDEQYVLPDAGK